MYVCVSVLVLPSPISHNSSKWERIYTFSGG